MLSSMLLALSFACGEKKTEIEVPTPPVEETTTEAVAEEPPAEEVTPEPEPDPKPVSNVDFNATVAFSDGTTVSGHVIRVERSSDFYGMKEWYDKESRLTIFAESGSTAKDLSWTEIKSVSVSPKSGDVSCVYESDWSPWQYICTNKTNTSIVDSEAKKWGVDTKNKWKFFFDDETEVEFWIQNYRALQQDTVEVELGMEAYENPELYAELQNEVKSMVYVKSITIQ